MTRLLKSWALVLAMLATGCGNPLHELPPPSAGSSGSSGASTGTSATSGSSAAAALVQGSVEKGPFLLGSSVALSAIDHRATPTGQIFHTQTMTDLGEFSLSIPYSGDVQIEAQGYFFDELDGSVSTSMLTLQGYGTVAGSAANLHVNVLTHLLSARVAALQQSGLAMDAAAWQAQRELVQSLGIGASKFALTGAANELGLANGPADDRAYLLTISVLFLRVAHDTATGADQVDARLQELLNDARSVFGSSGRLPAETVALLQSAEQELEPQAVRDTLQARFGDTAGFTVPDMDALLDSDLDGVANDLDACPLVPSADGGAMNGLCSYRRAYADGLAVAGGASLLVGDFNGDGLPDVIQGELGSGSETGLWLGTGGGAMAPHVRIAPQDFLGTGVADVNGDGHLDLVGLGNFGASGPLLPSYAAWTPGFGDGGFAPAQALIPERIVLATPDTDDGGATYACFGPHMADLDGDGRLDAVVPCEELELNPAGANAVLVSLQLADGSFGAPTRLALPSSIDVTGLEVADFDGDGTPDIVIGSCGGYDCGDGGSWWNPSGGLWIARGAGDGSFTLEALATSVGPSYPALLAGDLDGDGFPDLVSSRQTAAGANEVNVLVNDGTGHFDASSSYDLANAPSAAPLLLDMTRDGRPDLVFMGSASLVMYPATPTGWGPPQTLVMSASRLSGLGFGDLDGDGHPDLASLTSDGQQLETVVLNPSGYHSW